MVGGGGGGSGGGERGEGARGSVQIGMASRKRLIPNGKTKSETRMTSSVVKQDPNI